MPIKAVILHLESTLVQKGILEAKTLKAEIGCPPEISILDYVRGMLKAEEKSRVLTVLEELELSAADHAKPAPGAEAIAHYFVRKELGLAIVSHRSLASVRKMLDALSFINIADLGAVISREQLLEAVHGVAFDGYDRSVDSHVKNLRRKIEPDPRQPRYIQTVYGLGYRFVDR